MCDPPYELGFMGKGWDSSGVAFRVETWREAVQRVFRALCIDRGRPGDSSGRRNGERKREGRIAQHRRRRGEI